MRELEAGDADAIAPMLMHPDVMQFWPRPYTKEGVKEWIAKWRERYERDGYGYWLALDRVNGEVIGQIGVIKQLIDGEEEQGLGYIIHRPFWGKGYAREGANAAINWTFEVLGKNRVISTIRPANVASLKVAIQLGMMPEKITMYAEFEHLVFVKNRG